MNGPFRVSAFQSGRKALESLIEIRKRNQRTQKTASRGGLFGFQTEQGAPGRYNLVPGGDSNSAFYSTFCKGLGVRV